MPRKFQGQKKVAQQSAGQSRKKRFQKTDSQSGDTDTSGTYESRSAIASSQNQQSTPVSYEYIASDLIQTVIIAAIAFIILIILWVVL